MNAPRRVVLCALALLLAAGLGAGGVYLAGSFYFSRKLDAAAQQYAVDSAILERRLDDAQAKARDAEDASASASRELAEYRSATEKRERERQETIGRIIGEASQGESGAEEITSGLGGDIEIAGRLETRYSQLVDGLRELQTSSRGGNAQ